MTIGKLAKAAEVSVETVRFYQRKGLIKEPPKALGGFRYYDQQILEDLRFIKRAQIIGFALDEIKDLLSMNPCTCCEQAHDATLLKLRMLEGRIAELERIRQTLLQLVQECEKTKYQALCPIIDGLHKGSRHS